MEFLDLGKELRGMAEGLEKGFISAEKRSLSDLETEAHAASHGSLSYRTLARLGHPYARRALRLNPRIVNIHTGNFDRGWKTVGPKESQGGITSTLWNESKEASFFEEGTLRMVARHPEELAADTIEERRVERLEDVLNGYFE